MKKQLLRITVFISALFMILAPAICGSLASDDISVETTQTGKFSLEYELLIMIPGGHKLQIDEEGLLTKKYYGAKNDEKNSITTNLSHCELAELIMVSYIGKRFF